MVRTYVGRRVEKLFSSDDGGGMTLFGGEVIGRGLPRRRGSPPHRARARILRRYDMEVGWFKVLYDDDDSEEMDLASLAEILVRAAGEPAAVPAAAGDGGRGEGSETEESEAPAPAPAQRGRGRGRRGGGRGGGRGRGRGRGGRGPSVAKAAAKPAAKKRAAAADGAPAAKKVKAGAAPNHGEPKMGQTARCRATGVVGVVVAVKSGGWRELRRPSGDVVVRRKNGLDVVPGGTADAGAPPASDGDEARARADDPPADASVATAASPSAEGDETAEEDAAPAPARKPRAAPATSGNGQADVGCMAACSRTGAVGTIVVAKHGGWRVVRERDGAEIMCRKGNLTFLDPGSPAARAAVAAAAARKRKLKSEAAAAAAAAGGENAPDDDGDAATITQETPGLEDAHRLRDAFRDDGGDDDGPIAEDASKLRGAFDDAFVFDDESELPSAPAAAAGDGDERSASARAFDPPRFSNDSPRPPSCLDGDSLLDAGDAHSLASGRLRDDSYGLAPSTVGEHDALDGVTLLPAVGAAPAPRAGAFKFVPIADDAFPTLDAVLV